jgi:Cu+-exporting ATPase
MSELRLRIGGMHCVNCAGRIEKELVTLAGIKTATVNFASETFLVDYQAATISPEMIAASLSILRRQSVDEAHRDLY